MPVPPPGVFGGSRAWSPWKEGWPVHWLAVGTNFRCVAVGCGDALKYRKLSSCVPGRGFTPGNESACPVMIFVQLAAMLPSQSGLALLLPARHEYASNERRPTKRLLNLAETPSRLIDTPVPAFPSLMTLHRVFTGTRQVAVGVQLWVFVVPSLSSIRLFGVTFVPVAGASVVIVAPCVAEA